MPTMYTCSFVDYSGEICMRRCTRSAGCCFYYKALAHNPCSECGKPTRSISGRCQAHIRSFYVGRYYQKHLKKKRVLVQLWLE
ncbi:hypothetical protein Glove_67g164 [Diversispora epigaea]|uniref:Uncharacterized protein n=1 Tax=Diversispora epigaea TaxID=1348612 RepID=A0A397JBC9_9GLOM|nr:hypothetical protein Glove_67g164 [Diversispora epigaea]